MWWLILLVLAGLVTLLVVKRAFALYGADKFPPVRSGWVPWVGCALEFGKEPLNFIKRTKDEVKYVIPQLHYYPLYS